MKTDQQAPPSAQRYQPFVPESVTMTEFTWRALFIGLPLTLILGAANAYLGLRAGVTIAATYPAAVISMAVLRMFRGSILEENIARTAGSIGESVAAGAIFTLPAFVIAGVWPSFRPGDAYWKSTALMLVGSVLGVLFVSLVRRVMVEDPTLPFPESVAAGEIHKAGQRGSQAAKYLFYNMGFGAVVYFLGALKLFAVDFDRFVSVGSLGARIRLGAGANAPAIPTGGVTKFAAPSVSPAYLGVGYIIGPELAALNFSGGVLAWGLMVPLLIFLLGPQLQSFLPAGGAAGEDWIGMVVPVWRYIVRPIAVGGMLVGAAYTLFRMRKNLFGGLRRAFAEFRSGPESQASVARTERYMSWKTVFSLIGLLFVLMTVLYMYMSGLVAGAIVAAVVMLIAGFFFAALLMVALGVSGTSGVVAVLGVASVVCVSAAVAGELLQDFKVGWILGGTPRTIQIVELIAVVCASLVMYFPVMILHEGNIAQGGIGFGDPKLSAPQAGLMAALAQGIVGGDMAWSLVVVGILFGAAMIMLRVKSPMLVAVGMYLPLETTFAIFIGGMIRWFTDTQRDRRGYNEAQKIRVENVGILAASGLIAGEALVGLVTAAFNFFDLPLPSIFRNPSYILGLAVMTVIAFVLVRVPLANAGSPDEPAPPAAMV